jgi:hypothetical protein
MSPLSAHAGLWTGSGGQSYAPPITNYFGPGPQSNGGITWTSTNTDNVYESVYGYTGTYGFQGNGSWNGTPMEGLNHSYDVYGVVDSMTFTFANPVKGFGGEIDWAPSSTPVTIAAYNSAGQLVDTLTLASGMSNLQTPDAFYGFEDNTADIKSFVLTDGFIGIRNIEIAGVPEPASWAMLLLGLGGLGAAMRLTRRRTEGAPAAA